VLTGDSVARGEGFRVGVPSSTNCASARKTRKDDWPSDSGRPVSDPIAADKV
jgi:hypothetical protein